MGRIEDAPDLIIAHVHSLTNSCKMCHFAHQFAHQFLHLHISLAFRSPHSSKVRSPIRKHFVNSLTNSLTNHSYHMRPQISHLTVLKFAHQFAPSGCSFDCTDPACHRNLASHIREIARKCDITSQQVAQLALKCQLILARKSSNKPLIPRNKLLNHTVLSSEMGCIINGSHRRCSRPYNRSCSFAHQFM